MVGDDAQAIYAFRAATVRNILDFPHRFAPPAEIVTLEQNYRSTQPILAAANAVIGLAARALPQGAVLDPRARRSGRGWPWSATTSPRPSTSRRQVLANREAGLALRDQAVLFRTASHSAALELELARRNIPYVKYGGLRFFEAAHVKDVLAMLRWAENPRDRVAAFRVLQLLPGIGPGTARKRAWTRAPASSRRWRGVRPPPAAAELWPRLVAAAGATWRRHPGRRSSALVRALLRPAAGRALRLHRRAGAPISTSSSAWPPPRRRRERFLTELTLDPPQPAAEPPARRTRTRTI